MDAPDYDEPQLNIPKHILYWRRCLKTYLPHLYTGYDSSRMTLAFFILSALDLLGELDASLSPAARKGHIEWVYSCQLPEGGFRAFPGADLGPSRNNENRVWDPASVPATFFALLCLALLGDDLQRVKRREILEWLRRMQREDGSFGDFLGEYGRIEGGKDTRFGYMSTGIRWILRGNTQGPVDGIADINVDSFVECVRKAETYDGGISDGPFHEAHAGFTCCAISALAFVDRLPIQSNSSQQSDHTVRGLSNLPLTLRWLVSRQTTVIEQFEETSDAADDETEETAAPSDDRSFIKLKSHPPNEGVPQERADSCWVGVNGRCNKIGDTCYAYWVGTPLSILDRLHLIDPKPIRRWLLEKTQHLIGGFGKISGDPPDILHSYLGLAALATLGDPSLKSFDAALCVSNDVKRHIESLGWRRAIVGLDAQVEETKDNLSYVAISGG